MIHFLRPYWLMSLLPIVLFILYFKPYSGVAHGWKKVCDKHLLPHLITQRLNDKSYFPWLSLLSLTFMIIGLSGPAFVKLPVPVYQPQQAHVLILDLSNTMLAEDIKPNRLKRAKFKLSDLLRSQKTLGQLGLVVYSKEAFVASPLTDDAKTIDALMDVLTPSIMPVAGNRLDIALEEGYQLIKQSRQAHGDLLVLTAETPSKRAINRAETLAKKNISISILPLLPPSQVSPLFSDFAKAGKGHMIPFTETSADIFKWFNTTQSTPAYKKIKQDTIPLWRDDGRWFLIPAILLLLMRFRNHSHSRVGV